MESLENKKYYEWTSTSRIGKVEAYLAEDDTNIYFESGRLIPKDQFGYQLNQIDEEVYLRKKDVESSPIRTPIEYQQSNWESLLGNESTSIQNSPIQTPIAEQNPIKIILDKQKKKEKIIIPISFEFEIPSKKVLDLLDVMFDRDEVIEEIIKSTIGNIQTESVIEKISEEVKTKIHSFFDNEEKDDLKNEMSIN
jgi:hypothetical protein